MREQIIQMVVGFLLAAVSYYWGLRKGRNQERDRTDWEINRLFQEGRLSASLRILCRRLDGDSKYNEPLPNKDKPSS